MPDNSYKIKFSGDFYVYQKCFKAILTIIKSNSGPHAPSLKTPGEAPARRPGPLPLVSAPAVSISPVNVIISVGWVHTERYSKVTLYKY